MVGYFLRHSFFLVSVGGAGLGVAIALAFPLSRSQLRPFRFLRLKKVLLPGSLIVAVAAIGGAFLSDTGGLLIDGWLWALGEAIAFALITMVAVYLPSFFKILIILPAATLFAVGGVLWVPIPRLDGSPSDPTRIVIHRETERHNPGTSPVAIVRVQRSLEGNEPVVLMLPTVPVSVGTVRAVPLEQGRIRAEVDVLSVATVFWWLPPTGTLLRVETGEAALERYPSDHVSTRILTVLQQWGAVTRRTLSVEYPENPGMYAQPGIYSLSIMRGPLSFRGISTDDL